MINYKFDITLIYPSIFHIFKNWNIIIGLLKERFYSRIKILFRFNVNQHAVYVFDAHYWMLRYYKNRVDHQLHYLL